MKNQKILYHTLCVVVLLIAGITQALANCVVYPQPDATVNFGTVTVTSDIPVGGVIASQSIPATNLHQPCLWNKPSGHWGSRFAKWVLFYVPLYFKPCLDRPDCSLWCESDHCRSHKNIWYARSRGFRYKAIGRQKFLLFLSGTSGQSVQHGKYNNCRSFPVMYRSDAYGCGKFKQSSHHRVYRYQQHHSQCGASD